MRLADLPVDLLLDVVLPVLELPSLVHLGQTSKSFHTLIFTSATADSLWKARLAQDLNFPTSNTARTTGWLELYQRVLHPELYGWGAVSNFRLGVQIQERRNAPVTAGGIAEPTRIKVDDQRLVPRFVDLAAGGWSSHALDSNGQVWSCGQLNGDLWVPATEPLTSPFASVSSLSQLPCQFPRPLKSIDAGRTHVVGLDGTQRAYEWHSFGRVAQIHDVNGRWTRVSALSAGWDCTAVLVKRPKEPAQAFVHFPPSYAELALAASSVPFASEGYEPATTHFEMAVHSIQLPALSEPLPNESIDLIAAGNNFVVALTNEHRVFKIDISPIPQQGPRDDVNEQLDGESRSSRERERLSAAFAGGQRTWVYLPEFSELALIRKHPALQDRTITATRITHITAHFQTFTAYAVNSVKESSLVLFGDSESNADSRPHILPALQGIGVIKVCLGDYHKGALTSDGKLLTWGAYSSGALGHGHRNKNLPEGERGWRDPSEPLQVAGRSTYDLANPREVQFKLGQANSKFVFNAAFSGWHSLALAVDLDPKKPEEEEEEEEEPPSPVIPGAYPEQPAVSNNPTPAIGNHPFRVFNPAHIRLGYPARGMNRAGFGRGA